MSVTYDEHKAWLIRSREGFQAEFEGFTAASYASEPPPFYVHDPGLRERFELGFGNGKVMLKQEAVYRADVETMTAEAVFKGGGDE